MSFPVCKYSLLGIILLVITRQCCSGNPANTSFQMPPETTAKPEWYWGSLATWDGVGVVVGDSNRAAEGLGSRDGVGLGSNLIVLGLGHCPSAGASRAGRAVLSVTAAPSHSSHLGKPGRPGDGENIQPRVLIMCCGCRNQEGRGWVRLGSSRSYSQALAGLW